MYEKILAAYDKTILKSFTQVELELFEYIVNSFPDIMLASVINKELVLNEGMITFLALLTKSLGPSRELILNLENARSFSNLYELASKGDPGESDILTSLEVQRLKLPSLKLLELLISDTWPDLAELFVDDKTALDIITNTQSTSIAEAIVPLMRSSGTQDTLSTVIKSYISQDFEIVAPMEAKLSTQVFYSDSSLYNLLLHLKPAGYKITIGQTGTPLLTNLIDVILSSSIDTKCFPPVYNNGTAEYLPYPRPGSPLVPPSVSVSASSLSPAGIVYCSTRHYEPLKVTQETTITYSDSTTAIATSNDIISSTPSSSVKTKSLNFLNYKQQSGTVTKTEVTLTPVDLLVNNEIILYLRYYKTSDPANYYIGHAKVINDGTTRAIKYLTYNNTTQDLLSEVTLWEHNTGWQKEFITLTNLHSLQVLTVKKVYNQDVFFDENTTAPLLVTSGLKTMDSFNIWIEPVLIDTRPSVTTTIFPNKIISGSYPI